MSETTVDPVVVASKQYTVVADNDQVRILKIDYQTQERGPMHDHPESVLFCLTDLRSRFTYPDGGSEEIVVPAGGFKHMPAMRHEVENLTKNRFEGFLVELK